MPAPERGPELAAKLAAAQPGAVIELDTGTYTGVFTISQKADLTIRSRPGAHAVLTLRDARFLAVPNALWTPVEGAPGVYRIPEVVGSSIYRLNGARILYGRDRAHFDVLAADHVDSAWRGTGETLLHLNGDDPRTTPLYVSKTDQAVIACDRSPRLRLEGLDVRFGGAVGINFGAGCDGSVIDGVTIFGGRDGVRAKDGVSSGITVRHSWIVNSNVRRWYYRDVKGSPIIEGSALFLPGKNQRAEANIVQGWFNGISTFCVASTCPSVDAAFRRNLIQDILDDAIELDGVTVRGEVAENLVLDAMIGFSFSPRQVQTPGQDTRVHHNAIQSTRVPPMDRPTATTPATLGHPQGTKFNSHPVVDGVPTAARDLLFENNTWVCDSECARGAPTGQQAYPSRVRWLRNVFVSRIGPIVRDAGGPAEGNGFETNAYFLSDPNGNLAYNWAQPYDGTRTIYKSLAEARSSPKGIAAGWEAQGVQADPLLSRPGEPSSLRTGSPAAGRGAFERAPLRIDETLRLATGWILVRGAGFESSGLGLGLSNPIVVSSTTAFGRDLDPPPAPPRMLSVETVP